MRNLNIFILRRGCVTPNCFHCNDIAHFIHKEGQELIADSNSHYIEFDTLKGKKKLEAAKEIDPTIDIEKETAKALIARGRGLIDNQ